MKKTDWRQEVEKWCEEKRFHDQTRRRWLKLRGEDGLALWELTSELRLGENQLRDLWEWAEEIAQRDKISLANVLRAPQLQAVRARKVSRNDRLRLVREELRRWRFPELVAMEEEMAALVRAAGLPPEVQVRLPTNLEGDTIEVRITARSAEELLRCVQALRRWASSDSCRQLFILLGEAT